MNVRDVLSALVASGRWPEALSEPGVLESLLADADQLPPLDAVGFEVRLAGDRNVDFGAALRASSRSHLVLADSTHLADSSSPSSWGRVSSFCEIWATAGTLAHQVVTHAFLEFDTSRGERFSNPSLFMGLLAMGPEALLAAARLALGILSEGEREHFESLIEDRLQRLPRGSVILHMGVMLGRADGVRVHALVPSGVAPFYAQEVIGSDEADRLREILSRYAPEHPMTALQFELSPYRRTAAVGVELSCDEGPAGRSVKFLERLVDDGLCEPVRADALSRWSADYRSPCFVEGWPCRLQHRLSHVKITVRPGQPLRAKAYLSVVPSFSLFGPR